MNKFALFNAYELRTLYNGLDIALGKFRNLDLKRDFNRWKLESAEALKAELKAEFHVRQPVFGRPLKS